MKIYGGKFGNIEMFLRRFFLSGAEQGWQREIINLYRPAGRWNEHGKNHSESSELLSSPLSSRKSEPDKRDHVLVRLCMIERTLKHLPSIDILSIVFLWTYSLFLRQELLFVGHWNPGIQRRQLKNPSTPDGAHRFWIFFSSVMTKSFF